MTKSYIAKKRELSKRIDDVKKNLETNKRTFENNISLFKYQKELTKANEENIAFETKRYDLHKSILEVELKDMRVVNPINSFHSNPEWQELFRKTKELEAEEVERNFKMIQKNFEMQKNKIDRFRFAQMDVSKEELEAQQQRIKETHPQLEEQLINLGEKVPDELKFIDNPKQHPEYIG